jgi:hypothetical protein
MVVRQRDLIGIPRRAAGIFARGDRSRGEAGGMSSASREKGRYVRKGEKAITLCQPVTVKRTPAGDQPLSADSPQPAVDQHPEMFTRFIYRPHWFVLATETQMTEKVFSPTFGQPVSFVDPRRAMLGVRLNLGR